MLSLECLDERQACIEEGECLIALTTLEESDRGDFDVKTFAKSLSQAKKTALEYAKCVANGCGFNIGELLESSSSRIVVSALVLIVGFMFLAFWM